MPVGTSVTLTAAPDAGHTFAGWTGACTGTVPTCTVTLTANVLVGATFEAPLTTPQYYHLDALGSVRAVTDASGAVLERHDYRPFGEDTMPLPPAGGVAARFTGQDRDTETGFDDFGARYYSMHTGRLGGVDPVIDPAAVTQPQRWNRYAYALNNPLRFVDPTGLEANPGYLEGGAGDTPDTLIAINIANSDEDLSDSLAELRRETGVDYAPGDQSIRSATSTSPENVDPPSPPSCVKLDTAQKGPMLLAQWLAKTSGLTVGIGVTGSAGAMRGPFGLMAGVSFEVVATPNGEQALTATLTTNAIPLLGGIGFGAGAFTGPQISFSTAKRVSDLGGVSFDVSGNGGTPLGISLDLSLADRAVTGSLGGGLSWGGKASAGVFQFTSVTPVCRQ